MVPFKIQGSLTFTSPKPVEINTYSWRIDREEYGILAELIVATLFSCPLELSAAQSLEDG